MKHYADDWYKPDQRDTQERTTQVLLDRIAGLEREIDRLRAELARTQSQTDAPKYIQPQAAYPQPTITAGAMWS